ncbi:MAG: tRNA lysidine(34) synthetase TilS [Acidobacteria bacterium]|nr:tRNA lysidine(34) synthetase TilS [Acidobacteriota bacterium]
MLATVAASLGRLGLAGAKLGVAVSGGADSVFLLHALRQVYPGPLVVLHVNHGLRGPASDEDEAFVRTLAPEQFRSARSLPVTGNLEQHCRRERLRFFGEWIRSGVVDHVATGHTASDQAETVLLRLLRGTGPTGLRGILPRTREGLVRPLLDLDRDAIRCYLRDHRVPWREDASNADPRFLRNRVRATLLPLLRELEPRVEANLGRLAAIACSEEEYWATQMPPPTSVLDVNSLQAAHPALRRRILRHAIAAGKGDLLRIEKCHLESLESLVLQSNGDGGVSLPGLEVSRSMGWIRVASPTAPEYRYTENVVLHLDGGRLQGPLRVRAWQPGDCFQPEGRVEPISVKKLFQNARVPLWERKNWPIITDGVSIVWMHRFGVDPKFAATGDTGNILRFETRISWVGESNSSSSTSCI